MKERKKERRTKEERKEGKKKESKERRKDEEKKERKKVCNAITKERSHLFCVFCRVSTSVNILSHRPLFAEGLVLHKVYCYTKNIYATYSVNRTPPLPKRTP